MLTALCLFKVFNLPLCYFLLLFFHYLTILFLFILLYIHIIQFVFELFKNLRCLTFSLQKGRNPSVPPVGRIEVNVLIH